MVVRFLSRLEGGGGGGGEGKGMDPRNQRQGIEHWFVDHWN